MLDINTVTIHDVGYKDGIFYLDVIHELDGDCTHKSIGESRDSDKLEYIWILLKHGFSYFNTCPSAFPSPNSEDVYWDAFAVFRFHMDDMGNLSERLAWEQLLLDIKHDFQRREPHILRGKSETDLNQLLSECVEEFDYQDRVRLDIKKLSSLVLFVYDYCILTLRESILDPVIGRYIKNDIRIGGQLWASTLSISKAIEHYLAKPYEVIQMTTPDGKTISVKRVKQLLELDYEASSLCQNPKAFDSNVAAMFVDLMHRFFIAFGIKKRGEWGRGEKILLFELLRFLGLCNSSKKAADSTYVSTLAYEHNDYFSECNLHSWIRDKSQPYWYLLCCGKHPLFDECPVFEYDITHPDFEGPSPISVDETLQEIAGTTIKCINNSNPYISFCTEVESQPTNEACITPNEDLSYVMNLIEEHFIYISFFPSGPPYIIIRKDLHKPSYWNRIVKEIQRRFKSEGDMLREAKKNKPAILNAINTFRELNGTEDRKRIDSKKLYELFLFIYDYVMFTYNETALRMEIKECINSTIEVNGKQLKSNALIDDMLREYLLHPYSFLNEKDKKLRIRRDGALYRPNVTPIIAHPANNTVNKTAMFYDLFARFFSTFGLSKRKGAKISELEKDLIAELANLSGISNTTKGTTIASIYLKNKDYFTKSQLSMSIRENEYWHLMLNTQEEELFGPPYHQ